MKILGIEFSTERRSVAVLSIDADGKVISKGNAVQEIERSTKAFALLESALKEADLPREEIDCIAVGIGPGSLTGIRMAISIAQGWQLAHPVKTIGISSFDCLTCRLQSQGTVGKVSVLLNTRQKQFSRKDFEITGDQIAEKASPASASADEIEALARGGSIIAGPGISRIASGGIDIFPDALALCKIASRTQTFTKAALLEPIIHNPVEFVKAEQK